MNKVTKTKSNDIGDSEGTNSPVLEVDVPEKEDLNKFPFQVKKFARLLRGIFQKVHEMDTELDILFEMIQEEMENSDEFDVGDEYHLVKPHHKSRKQNPVVLGDHDENTYIVSFGRGRQGKVKKIAKKLYVSNWGKPYYVKELFDKLRREGRQNEWQDHLSDIEESELNQVPRDI